MYLRLQGVRVWFRRWITSTCFRLSGLFLIFDVISAAGNCIALVSISSFIMFAVYCLCRNIALKKSHGVLIQIMKLWFSERKTINDDDFNWKYEWEETNFPKNVQNCIPRCVLFQPGKLADLLIAVLIVGGEDRTLWDRPSSFIRLFYAPCWVHSPLGVVRVYNLWNEWNKKKKRTWAILFLNKM